MHSRVSLLYQHSARRTLASQLNNSCLLEKSFIAFIMLWRENSHWTHDINSLDINFVNLFVGQSEVSTLPSGRSCFQYPSTSHQLFLATYLCVFSKYLLSLGLPNSKRSLNYHLAIQPTFPEWLNGNLATVLSSKYYSAIHTQTQTQTELEAHRMHQLAKYSDFSYVAHFCELKFCYLSTRRRLWGTSCGWSCAEIWQHNGSDV